MANSAFDHSPTITVPGSSTNTALVRWSGTGGKTFLDSTLLLSTSATPTLGIAADPDLLTFGNGTIAITGAITGVTTITATTFSGTLSGNSTGSAATLTNARTIGGVSFNGSANINLPGVNAVGDQNTSGTAAGLSATLVVASGGTGLASYTVGDMFYYASGTALTKLAKGTADQVLTMNDGATAPGWEDAAGGGDFSNNGDATSADRILGNNGNHALTFETNNTARMIITNDGKIGIDGVTTPNGNFTIGTASAVGTMTAPAIQIGSGQSNGFRLGLYSSAEGGHLHNNNGNDGILLESRDVEVARFWASGTNRHVGFGGITTPNDTMFKISYSAQSWVTNFTNAHGSGSNHVNQWNFGGFSPDSHNNIFVYAADTTAARIFIYSDGDITNHDNSYGSTSDERIKEGIRDANSQWDDIKAIKVRNFKKKEDVSQYGDRAWEQIGVIAQEVELVSPKLIREGAPSKFEMEQLGMGHEVENGENETKWIPNVDEDGNEVTIKSIGYSVLYMKAFKALQEAMARIETLETEVDALKG